MYNEKKIKDKVTKRVVLLGSIQTILFSLIFGRLYKLQIIDNEKCPFESAKNLHDFQSANLKMASLSGKHLKKKYIPILNIFLGLSANCELACEPC